MFECDCDGRGGMSRSEWMSLHSFAIAEDQQGHHDRRLPHPINSHCEVLGDEKMLQRWTWISTVQKPSAALGFSSSAHARHLGTSAPHSKIIEVAVVSLCAGGGTIW
mmetsp:Transcript_84542/g.272518  ORF Transcript_84542/g.272518 Transcript_84542/m.272518 type:complete len:107 (+) Transcript_84542:1927-2247(+)